MNLLKDSKVLVNGKKDEGNVNYELQLSIIMDSKIDFVS